MYEWRLMDFSFPDELPPLDCFPPVHIFLTHRKSAAEAFSDVKRVPDTLATHNHCRMLWADAHLRANGAVLWALDTTPQKPKDCHILFPFICRPENPQCEHLDNGYCLNGPIGCENRIIHPEAQTVY